MGKNIIGIVILALAILGAIIGVVIVASQDLERFNAWLIIGLIFFVMSSLIIVSAVLFESARRDRR